MASEQENLVHDLIGNEHQLVFRSSFSLAEKNFFSKKQGRPHGGTLWIIRKNLKIKDYVVLSEEISKIIIETNQFQEFTIYGNWLGYDDSRNRASSFSAFQNNLTLLASEIEFLNAKESQFLLVGDFNADLKRKRRFDKYLSSYLHENKLIACEDLFEKGDLNYTYKKGKNKAYIDHAICAANNNQFITGYGVLNDPENASDHLPLKIQAEFTEFATGPTDSIEKRKLKKHNFKWSNEFKVSFNKHLRKLLSPVNFSEYYNSTENDQEKIDIAYKLLSTTFLKAARKAENEVERTMPSKVNFKKVFNKTCHLNKEFQEIKIKIKQIYIDRKIYGLKLHNEDYILRKLKRGLRHIQKLIMHTMNDKQANKFEYLFKCKRSKFWLEVSRFKKKKPINSSNINMETFEKYYAQCFDSKNAASIPLHESINYKVLKKISDTKNIKYSLRFSSLQISIAIAQLNKGKAFGFDCVSAEMLIHADSDIINPILADFYSEIFNCNLIPTNFNISIVTPIPKNKEIPKHPANFRPISVFTVFANVFELLLLDNGAQNLKNMNRNQFGYQKNLSCKHAYFVIKECIHLYNSKNQNVEIAQLDAEKAFDTLWRIGLYYKLMDKIEPVFFRALVSYYSESNIIIRYNGETSKQIKTNDGVKQGGILSGYLFNFYMNQLIEDCVKLNIGCAIGEHNVSVIAYCDDLFLMGQSKIEMDNLLLKVEEYALKWKIKFNTNKCVNLTMHPTSTKTVRTAKLHLNGIQLTQKQNIIHLGLPIGTNLFIKKYWTEKMKSTVQSFYSLNGIGVRPFAMHPLSIAKIYRIYCQPKFLYGLEMVYINKATLSELNTTQATLIKTNLSLSKYALSTPLLNALRIESVKHLYSKFKVLFIKQLKQVPFTSSILNYLNEYYRVNTCPDQSFISQVYEVNRLLSLDILQSNTKLTLKLLADQFQNTDAELINKILNICTMMFEDKPRSQIYRDVLARLLYN